VTWNALTHEGKWAEVDDDVARVVREIERLYPELRVQYCADPAIGEYPFMVVERTRDGRDEPVLGVWQLDDRLLDLLHEADTTKHDVLKLLDKKNDKVRKGRSDEQLGWRDYCRDLIVHAARHKGSSYTFKDPREGHEGEIVKVTDS
jgi:hypothetical protein